jgi:hypothetical protein
MKVLLSAAVFGVLFLALSTPMAAQWPDYPTPGVPRLANGQPDVNAPTPRTPDGKPDFSGLWMAGLGRGGGQGGGQAAGEGQGQGQAPAQAQGQGQASPAAAGGAGRGQGRGQAATAAPDPNSPPVSQFFEVGGRGNPLPMQPWAEELKKKRMAEGSKGNPDAWCLPMGLMQFHNHPQPRRMVQSKDLLLIIYEANYGLRTIFLDGRPAPNNDPVPWWYGYSRGRWEGDTLVVETTNFRGDERAGWLDVNGSPYTEALKVTERFRRPSFGRLEIDVTIDDPKAYTKPFTVRVNQRIMVDSEIIEFICNENEQSSKNF